MPPARVTQSERKRLDATIASFHSNYASDSNWGAERWEKTLYPALLEPTRHAALVNVFAPTSDLQQNLRQADISAAELELLPLPQLQPDRASPIQCLIRNDRRSGEATSKPDQPAFPAPARAQPGALLTHWNMDAASALAAHMLDVRPGDRVLDLCAAPGGKSLALAQCLWPGAAAAAAAPAGPGCLHCNEPDPARHARLAANLRAYIPGALLQSGAVRAFRLDGAKPAERARLPHAAAAAYDRVLLDAPCASERHVLHAQRRGAAAELARWRPGALAATQAALLWGALAAVRVGGRVVYATCSLERRENDGVCERLLAALERERARGRRVDWGVRFEARAAPALDALTEPTRFGRIALPDHAGGGRWGPLFFAVITKVPA